MFIKRMLSAWINCYKKMWKRENCTIRRIRQPKTERPLPLARRWPHLIQQCLGPPHAPPQTAAPTVEALSHTDAVKSPLVTTTRPKFAPKSTPFPWTDPQTALPTSSLDPSNLWCQTVSGSDPPFFHSALNRPTDRQIVQEKVWWL